MPRLSGLGRRSRAPDQLRKRRKVGASGVVLLLLVVASAPAALASGSPPDAFDQSDLTPQDQPLSLFLNGSDPEGDPLTFAIVSPPAHGGLDDCSSGFCTYTPSAGYVGPDSFSWTANDGTSDSNTATYSITVEPAPILSSGPLTRVQITPDLNCAVDHTGDTAPEFYGDTACGTLVAVGGTLFRPAVIPAGGSAQPFLAFTPVSQSAVTGNGTDGDPFSIVTVVDLGSTGLRLTETDSYVVGQETYRTDVAIENTSGGSLDAILYRAGDCYLQESDFGFGFADPITGAVSCVAGVADGSGTTVPGTRIEQWYPLSSGSSYFESYYDSVWAQIGTQTSFADDCAECANYIDNAAGISWNVTIPAGGSITRSHLTVFSPLGVVPLATSKVAGESTVSAGGSDTYTITISNPNTSSASLTSITDTLPAGFAYVSGSTSGATTSDPTESGGGQTLTWAGPVTVSPGGTTSLTFGVTVSTTPGTYTNQAGATAESPFTVVGTGQTAPVTVVAPAHLTLAKTVDNTGGGTAAATDWTLSASGPTPISGATGDAAITDASVDAGTYTLAESGGPAGYTPGDWGCTGGTLTGDSLVLAAGETASCSITNTFIPPSPAHLTLAKTVDNTGGGTAAATDWTLSASGPTPISGATGDAAITDASVDAGTYTLAESGGPAGYTPGDWGCTGGTLTGDSLVLAAGETASCSITNTFIPPSPAHLTLAKTVDNTGGGTAAATDWTLSASGPTPISGATGDAAITDASVDAGTYTLAESGGPAGYTPGDWGCTGGTLTGDSLVLAAGETASCSITNTFIPPSPAHLTLAKTVDNTGGGTAAATDWTLSASGPTPISGATGDAAITDASVDAGTYTLAESGGPAGYTPGDWGCTGGTLTGDSLVLAAGETASCSITNTFIAGYLERGAFVIGDQDAQIGATVTWWSPMWWKANSLSGAPAPASFKGFAATFSVGGPVVGGTWSTGPGSKSQPPDTVPEYMVVIVTSSVAKSGSSISGDIVSIVLVKTDPTFGTGTVVSILSP